MFVNFEPSASARAQCYRKLAVMADEKAAVSSGTVQDSYQHLAEQWRMLAAHVEQPARACAISEQVEEMALHFCCDIRLMHHTR